MKRAPAAELTRAELAAMAGPDACPVPAPQPGYWHGSARSEVDHWRERALRAEAALAARGGRP